MPVINYRSWNAIRNVGDAVTPYIIELASGHTPQYGPADEPHLLGVGSILFMSNDRSLIWGSGVLNPHVRQPHLRREQFLALRGLKSAEFLRHKGIDFGSVPFGDPGIFAKEILEQDGFYCSAPTFEAAFVPHHSNSSHPLFRSVADSKSLCIVDVCDDSLEPIKTIARAGVVVSQSLHGVIFAESLGKPCLWISQRDDENWCFKFQDWFSTTDNPQKLPVTFDQNLSSMIAQAARLHSRIDKQCLLAQFPGSALAKEGSIRVPFRQVRQLQPVLLFLALPADALENVGQLKKSVASLCARYYVGWAEQPYTIAVFEGRGPIPTPAQAQAIISDMDRHHTFDAAFIIEKASTSQGELESRPIGAGVSRCKSEVKSGRMAGMIIRPMQEEHSVSNLTYVL